MEDEYLVVKNGNECTYFLVEIKYNNAYINDIYVFSQKNFNDEYGGIFLWVDSEKNIKMYDNIKKEFINDTHILYYVYNDIYQLNIKSIVKEILFYKYI